MRQHIACVATAIHRAHAARTQGNGGQTRHVGSVVAAEEGTHVIDAHRVGPGVISEILDYQIRTIIRADGVGIGLAESLVAASFEGTIDPHIGLCHVGCVAAGEDGVALSAVDDDVRGQARHLVAAAEEVADAEVATIARGGRACHTRREVNRSAIDSDIVLASGLVAAIVVATKHSESRTAIDGNGSAVGVSYSVGNESVLGTAKDGVNLHGIVRHRNGGLDDGGDGLGFCIARSVGVNSIALQVFHVFAIFDGNTCTRGSHKSVSVVV